MQHHDETEIPVTDRQWRERWAMELTRANELERKLAEANRSLSDWHAIAFANGDRAARAEVDAERGRAKIEIAYRRLRAETMRSTRARTAIDRLLGELRYSDADEHRVRAILDETVGTEECECGGTGYVRDERMVGAPGDSLGYRTETETVECDSCWAGRVPR